jgi:hypothetical protein
MCTEQLQVSTAIPDPQDQARVRRFRGVLTQMSLRDENVLYANTRGLSQNNRSYGFLPGYLNRANGECVLSRFQDGRPAPVHVLDGLPQSWIVSRDVNGHVTQAHPEVVSGFIRDGVFYTRDEAIRASAH